MARKFPTANVAVLDGRPGGITRVDIDDPALIELCIQRCGDTPVKAGTPSGGIHLWYRANGEHRTIGLEGEKIDILGRGGYGIAPPSINPRKGLYRFLEGGLADLDRLPCIMPGSLPAFVYRGGATTKGPAPLSSSGHVHENHRDALLFPEARRLALECRSPDEFMRKLCDINQTECDPPLSHAELKAKVKYVWRLKEEGRCFAPGTKYAAIPRDEAQPLYQYPPALALWHFLKCSHAPDHIFAVSPGGLSTVLPQSARTITKARDFLLNLEYLICTHKGGRGEGDADRFRFGRS